jgi:hypothetical protein
MQNSKYGILCLLLSCSPPQQPPLLISSMEALDPVEENVITRTLASSGQCLKDVFNVPTLREEMRQLERTVAAKGKVSGRWKHLDLSRLPTPQAQFLKDFGNKLGDLANPDAIDYSACEDVPCIYNKIYGKDSHVAGYVHYIWYLKFGSMLSADNHIWDQQSREPGMWNNKRHPLSSYLYNDRELYGLWRISHILKYPYRTLPDMHEVQRLPRGEKFEKVSDQGACGLASNNGQVLMADGCLALHAGNDSGSLYTAMTHELAHQVDFAAGRKIRRTFLSGENEYLAISKFTLDEHVNAQGDMVRRWRLAPGSKLVTNYAGISPHENFAETVAHYRLFGSVTKTKITSEQYNFVGKNFYQSKEFDVASLFQQWVDEYLSEAHSDLARSVVDCHENPVSSSSAFFKLGDFPGRVLPSAVQCISSQAEEISRKLRAQVMLQEPEACSAFSAGKASDWQAAVKRKLQPMYEVHLKAMQQDQNYLARIQTFYNELENKNFARESFFNCYGRAGAESCFNEDLRQRIFDQGITLKLASGQLKDFVDLYLARNTYEQTLQDAQQVYRQFVNRNQQQLRESTDELWGSCSGLTPDDTSAPRGGIFHISSGYMISSLYNCLNRTLPTTIQELVQNFSVAGIKIQHPKEQALLSQQVEEMLVKLLTDKYLTGKLSEAQTASAIMAKDQGELRRQLLADFSWVKDIIDQRNFYRECVSAGLNRMEFLPLFHLKKDLFAEYLESNSCLNIYDSAEFKAWLEQSKGGITSKAASDMLSKMHALATRQAGECLRTYPNDTNLNRIKFKKQREECLLGQWERMERQVMDELAQDQMVKRFNIPLVDLRNQLQTEARRLQIRVIRENFN